jgi:hypothetical protein
MNKIEQYISSTEFNSSEEKAYFRRVQKMRYNYDNAPFAFICILDLCLLVV